MMGDREDKMNWIWHIAARKILKRLVQLAVARIAALGLEQYGIKVDVDLLTASGYAAMELLRNWLKVRYGLGWL